VKGGIHGAHPSFDDLDEGDLKLHTDFRRIHATALEEVLETPPEPILAGNFEPMDLFGRRARVRLGRRVSSCLPGRLHSPSFRESSLLRSPDRKERPSG